MVLLLGLSVPPAAVAAASDPTVYWGAKTGPIDISATKWRQVAALPLPKGRFFVTATATLLGRGGTPNIRQQVACRLVLGSVKDFIHASPARVDYGGSRVPILLTVAGRLKSPGKARLRCYGADKRDDVAIRDIRITAVRAGRLTLQDGMELVAKRTTFGSGTPRIISARSVVGSWVTGSGSYQSVGSLALPKGRWWVIAKAVSFARGAPGFESADYRCRLGAGVDHDDLKFGLASTSPPSKGSRVPLGLQVVHWFRTPGGVSLECKGPSNMLIDHVVITAVKAGRLTNIPLEAAVGWTAGQGPPRIISGWANGPIGIPVRSTYKTIRQLDLPKGRWTVQAKLWFEGDPVKPASASPAMNLVQRAYCRLVFGRHKSPSQLRYSFDYSGTAPLVLSVNHRATTPQAVKLQCRRATDDGWGGAYFIKFTALRAGSLVKRPL
ncbi:MAG: hypothetical protein U9O18_05535 [Chloroflexota bacterium]|nr:hypothetical protein [Chloroflexota bacterium]